MDIDYSMVFRYFGAAIALGLGVVGAGLGEGHAAAKASEAITRQPAASVRIVNTMLVGQAVAESSSIFALVTALILIFQGGAGSGLVTGIAYLASGICIGIGTFGAGLGASLPVGKACLGVARQPRKNNVIVVTMLIGQSVSQTTAIFSLVIALILIFFV
ncbi:MAG: ATP synthase F0 subunit C [Candidatus Margulisiibacteriota bacterium]|nr:MAG: ATP synthase F0 subunit C [Candidatus Margulisbacteria bacterium GWD2_39_127]OGI02780.1 MAG: ATP synthase F0 subunit C [Candidatus Margulisbacteria bacterium GWF2_38_17]OGI09333.1 MAG: ATP synthase F0 subunit C [Candidatus Margulisbacteria bacterium GWE2_39_32]PZM77453.1 MAG: ATP synthase F0 subunit C [Candidatus Margulisiibacteriota bacterium]HAR63984.1 ATP synthase F0 subunit C [Candidatus Margulisiibacteriota bacterium]